MIGIYGIVDLFILKYSGYREALSSLGRSHQVHTFMNSTQVNTVTNLSVGDTQTYNFVAGQTDFVTPVTNSNPSHQAVVEYRYVFGETQTPWKKAVILPAQSTYFHALGVDTESPIRVADIEFRNFSWDFVVGYDVLQSERLQFVVQESEFQSSVQATEEQSYIPAKAVFTIVNNSAFSYKQVGYIVLLKNYFQKVYNFLLIVEF